MLVLSRKKNESIVINDDITIVVVEIRGDKVRLGVEKSIYELSAGRVSSQDEFDRFADAYEQNAEFYAFHRSLQAYRESLGQNRDIMVLAPDSEFFRYLRDPAGGAVPAPGDR